MTNTPQASQKSASTSSQPVQMESAAESPVESLSYEEARNQLQELVAGLERGDVPLQRTLEMWQRGQELLTHCRSILGTATTKVNLVSQENADVSE